MSTLTAASAPDLERHDIRLTLENHLRFQIETLDDYLTLFAAPGPCWGYRTSTSMPRWHHAVQMEVLELAHRAGEAPSLPRATTSIPIPHPSGDRGHAPGRRDPARPDWTA